MASKSTMQQLLELEKRVQQHAVFEGADPSGRKALVTVGATAPFRGLLAEVGTKEFMQTMRAFGYDEIMVQCGHDLAWFNHRIATFRSTYLTITTTDYIANMEAAMTHCRGNYGVKPGGVVVSHGGAGSILDAKRCGVALVVVANPSLANNHQVELVQEVAVRGWAVPAVLGEVADAIATSHEKLIEGCLEEAEKLRALANACGEDASAVRPAAAAALMFLD